MYGGVFRASDAILVYSYSLKTAQKLLTFTFVKCIGEDKTSFLRM